MRTETLRRLGHPGQSRHVRRGQVNRQVNVQFIPGQNVRRGYMQPPAVKDIPPFVRQIVELGGVDGFAIKFKLSEVRRYSLSIDANRLNLNGRERQCPVPRKSYLKRKLLSGGLYPIFADEIGTKVVVHPILD